MPASRPQNSTLEDRNSNTHQPITPSTTGASHSFTASPSGPTLPDQLSRTKHEPVDPKHSHPQQPFHRGSASATPNNPSLDQQRRRQHFDGDDRQPPHHAHDVIHPPQRPSKPTTTTTSFTATTTTTTEEEEEGGPSGRRRSKANNTTTPPSTRHHASPLASTKTAPAASAAAMSSPGDGEASPPRNSTDSRRSSGVSARSVAQPSQSPRNLTPSPTMAPQRHLGLLLRPGQGQGFGAMVGHALASGARSIVGSMVGSGGGSVASGPGTPVSVSPSVFNNHHHTSIVTGGGTTTTGRSPILTSEDSAEQTLLLVRPTWVQDQAVSECAICARTFSAVRRKHHCRQCGRVVCHDCSSRSLVLPQLGYTKAVRVCSGCFEVAYLVAYVLADDLGPTTQIHGARGLYDIVEGENERAIQNVLDHGGLDAMVFLCRLNHNYELHALATSFLATLTDKGDHMHMRIVNKRAMPNLYHLVTFYGLVQQQQQQQQQMPYGSSPPNGSPTRSSPSVTAHAINPTPMPLTRMGSLESVHTRTTKRIETVTLIMMNVTHVIFRMVSSNKELSRQLARDGGLDSLMTLSVYFPAGVRTRAMDNALRTMAQQSHPQQQQQHPSVPQRPSSAMSSLSVSYHELHSERSSASGRGSSLDLSEVPGGGSAVDEDDEDNLLIHMDEWFHQRLEGMQQLAAKSISIMASDAITQAYIVDDPERVDRLLQLLYSNNPDVVKYAAKTTAFLSLRNDKHKTNLVRGAGVAALLMVIRLAREQHFIEAAEHDDGYQLTSATATEGVSRRSSSSPSIGSGNNSNMGGPRLPSEAVSHACCTLANLATNIESQEVLMSHPDLIDATCGVVGLYPSQTEVERHVARLLANLALYDQNKLCMLTDHSTMYGQSTATKPSTSHPYRYSSPSPPPLLRTMGNVVPTLMYIGAMTLELPSYMPGFQDPLDPYHARHPAAVIPDNFELAASLQEPFEVPELPSKESGDEYDVPTSHHHHHHHHHPASYTSYGTSPRHPGFAPSSASPSSHTLTATTMAAAMAHSPIIPAEVWRTVPGTEDIQRHFIRAIDNLLTTPATTPTGPMTPGVVAGGPFGTHSIFDPSEFVNEQTFQVFLKLWPTTSLIVAIRAATRDEDTQRRATHVLRTLKQQRMAHRAFVERFMMAYPASSSVPSQHQQQEQQREEEEEEEEEEEDVRRGDEVEEEKEQEDRRHAAAAEEEERRRIQQQEEEEAEAAAKLKEQQEQEQQEQQRKKAEEEEARRKQEEEAEIKRREEEERRQREQAEKEKAEEERRRQEQEEIERQEEERRQKEAEEKGRLEKEAEEKARLEKEAEEKARLEKEAEERERLKKEAEEKERLEKEAEEKERLEKEAEEKARLKKEAEEKARLEKEAKEKAEQARKKKEKEEMEQEEEQRRKNEAKLAQKEEEARLEKQEKERERIQQNLAKLRKKLEEERLQNQSKDGHESTDTSATGDEMSTTEDEAPSRSVTPAPGGSSSEKTKSSSKDKDKKKKKKKSK